jgi:hypothetical protein
MLWNDLAYDYLLQNEYRFTDTVTLEANDTGLCQHATAGTLRAVRNTSSESGRWSNCSKLPASKTARLSDALRTGVPSPLPVLVGGSLR